MNRFAPGTFSPDPRPASVPTMLAAQFGLELKLLLRNGEQLLLTIGAEVSALSFERSSLEQANDILTATVNRSKMSTTIIPSVLAR